MRHILHDDEHASLVMVDSGRRDVLVITFDPNPPPSGEHSPRGFGERFLEQAGISALHVIPKARHWYCFEGIRTVVAMAASIRQSFERVVTYGSSMGGYAAYRFANDVYADVVLAFSPQASIDTKHLPEDRRWRGTWANLREDPKPKSVDRGKVYLVYDWTCHLDRMQALGIIANEVRHLPVPFSGHHSITMLNQAGILKPLVLDIIEDRFDWSVHRNAMRAQRQLMPAYAYGMFRDVAESQSPRRDKRGASVLHNALQNHSAEHSALTALAKLVLRKEMHECAEILDAYAQASNKRWLTKALEEERSRIDFSLKARKARVESRISARRISRLSSKS